MHICIHAYIHTYVYKKKVFFVKTDCPSFNGRKAAPERKLALACFAEARLLFFFPLLCVQLCSTRI